MCLSLPRVELEGTKISMFESYNVHKWEIRFTLGLSAAKNTHNIKKKASNKNCSELNFVLKVRECIYLSPLECS